MIKFWWDPDHHADCPIENPVIAQNNNTLLFLFFSSSSGSFSPPPHPFLIVGLLNHHFLFYLFIYLLGGGGGMDRGKEANPTRTTHAPSQPPTPLLFFFIFQTKIIDLLCSHIQVLFGGESIYVSKWISKSQCLVKTATVIYMRPPASIILSCI